MSKLTLDALKSKADAVASNELLATISGGTENDCHPCTTCEIGDDGAYPNEGGQNLGHRLYHWLFDE